MMRNIRVVLVLSPDERFFFYGAVLDLKIPFDVVMVGCESSVVDSLPKSILLRYFCIKQSTVCICVSLAILNPFCAIQLSSSLSLGALPTDVRNEHVLKGRHPGRECN